MSQKRAPRVRRRKPELAPGPERGALPAADGSSRGLLPSLPGLVRGLGPRSDPLPGLHGAQVGAHTARPSARRPVPLATVASTGGPGRPSRGAGPPPSPPRGPRKPVRSAAGEGGHSGPVEGAVTHPFSSFPREGRCWVVSPALTNASRRLRLGFGGSGHLTP